jgi:hypothetical protein
MSRIPNRKPHSPSAPAPAPEPAPPPEAAAAPVAEPATTPREDRRDENGRFTKGNRGGFGNPFARRTAAFRRALAEAVSDDMIAAVVRKLAELAQAGDVAAIKLFLAYTVGKPAEAVNPDTLDADEYRVYQQEQVDLNGFHQIAARPTLDFMLKTVRPIRPGLDQVHADFVLDQLDEMAEADREAAARAAQEAAAPAAATGAGEDAAGEEGPAGGRGDTVSRKGEGAGARPARPVRGGNGNPAPSPIGDNGGRGRPERGPERPRRDNPGGRPGGMSWPHAGPESP